MRLMRKELSSICTWSALGPSDWEAFAAASAATFASSSVSPADLEALASSSDLVTCVDVDHDKLDKRMTSKHDPKNSMGQSSAVLVAS